MDARFYKTFQGDAGETRSAAQRTRHFVNLFENPVLFYAACITAMVVGQGSGAMVLLAWVFVICRVLHAVVHLGSNRILPRMTVYGVGWVVLLAMWVMLVIRVASSS